MKLDLPRYIVTYTLLLACAHYFCSAQDSDIQNYKTPKNCIALYTKDGTGAALQCELPVITAYETNMSVVPSKYTQSLQMTCTLPWYVESTLENISFAHLNELKELVFLNCKFSEFTENVFASLEDQLIYLTVRCEHDAQHELQIHKSAIGNLRNLLALDLAGNRVRELPENEICTLANLQEINVRNNELSNISNFGFSGKCSAEDWSEPCCGNLTLLNLSNNRFVEIPSNSFCKIKNLKYLSVEQNHLKVVEAGAFSNLRALVELSLSENNITALPPNIWSDLETVNFLNISHNQINGILDEFAFQHLKSIKVLDASFNQIQTITNSAFQNLTNLTYLSLSSNQIEHLHNGTFSNLKNLATLLLQDNNILTITNVTFLGMPNLNFLWLHGNHLRTIDMSAFQSCAGLINLRLANNYLTDIPAISHLTNLTSIDLSENNISSLNENAFAGLTNLMDINLSGNKLKAVPEALFANLTTLSTVNLGHNELASIHGSSFVSNPSLKHLILHHNHLSIIVNLQLNSQLISLNISYNALTTLHYGILPKSLNTLNADHNKIRSLEETFYTASTIPITHMNLEHNQITTLGTKSLPQTLKVVNLNFNKISYIEAGTFAKMESLEKVSLEENLIEILPKRVLFTNSKNRRRPTFLLSGNRLRCTCEMLWFKTINEAANDEYGFVANLGNMFCWLPKDNKPKEHELKLISDSSDINFLCEYETHTFSDPFCFNLTMDGQQICNIACPENCSCLRDQSWNIVITMCSWANFTSVPKGIPAMSTVLYLDGNSILMLDQNSFEFYPKLEKLYLNNTELRSIEEKTFINMVHLQVLHMENNYLENLMMNVFDGLQNLTELYLFSNKLHQMHAEVFVPLQSLTIIQLQNNELTDFPVWSFRQLTQLKSIGLVKNPWSCDCDYVNKYREWLQESAGIILEVERLVCYPEFNKTVAISLIDFNATFCVDPIHISLSQIPVIVSMTLIFLTITVISILIFVYRHEMQVLIYTRYGVRLLNRNKEVNNEMKRYDAFISYSNVDEEFVVRQLLPKLENLEFPYKLCLHQRDFAVGAFITESILEAVEFSRRTILIFTENFIQSEWCRFEFKTAHLQMMKDRCNRVIMVVVGEIPKDLDPEMKLYFKTNTYLQWDDKLFWQKLYFALPEKRPRN